MAGPVPDSLADLGFMHAPSEDEKILYDRLSPIEFRWRLRCIRRRLHGAAPRVRVTRRPEADGWESFRIMLPPRLRDEADFLRRYTHDPWFWGLVETCTNPDGSHAGVHHRGIQYARRRKALLQVWMRLLVAGQVAMDDFPNGPLTSKTVRSLLERGDWNYHVLDFGRPAPQRRKSIDARRRPRTPFVVGPVTPDELREFHQAQFELHDGGEPAASTQTSLMERIDAAMWAAEPRYVESLLEFQSAALRYLAKSSFPPGTEPVRRRLASDLGVGWWVLRKVHMYCAIDVALDWWASLAPATRRAWLARRTRQVWTPRRAGEVARSLRKRRPGTGRALSADAAAMQFLTIGAHLTRRDPAAGRIAFAAVARQRPPNRVLAAMAEYNLLPRDADGAPRAGLGAWRRRWMNGPTRAAFAFVDEHWPPRMMTQGNVPAVAPLEWRTIR